MNENVIHLYRVKAGKHNRSIDPNKEKKGRRTYAKGEVFKAYPESVTGSMDQLKDLGPMKVTAVSEGLQEETAEKSFDRALKSGVIDEEKEEIVTPDAELYAQTVLETKSAGRRGTPEAPIERELKEVGDDLYDVINPVTGEPINDVPLDKATAESMIKPGKDAK